MLDANSKLEIPILSKKIHHIEENKTGYGTLYFKHIDSSQHTMQGELYCQKQIHGSHHKCYRPFTKVKELSTVITYKRWSP